MTLNTKITVFAALLMAFGLVACDGGSSDAEETAAPVTLMNQQDSLSYSIGVDVANGLAAQGFDINGDLFAAGFKEAQAGAPMLTAEQCRQVIMDFQMAKQREMMAQMQAQADPAAAAANAEEGAKFLEENKSKPGVIVHESGLQYRIDKEGTGASPNLNDKVVVHYKGTLLDGTQFDSSYERGQPAEFQPMGLIQAWQIVLPLMKEGAKYTIYSPSELAYGPAGSPPNIGPNATLIFEMELLEVKPAQ